MHKRIAWTFAALLMMTTVPVGAADLLFFSLSIHGPSVVLEGDTVRFDGRWQAALTGFSGTEVRLYVDGQPADWDIPVMGDWAVDHKFASRGLHTVQAVGDPGLPTETHSPIMQVRVAAPPEPVREVVATPVAGLMAARVTWQAPVDDGGAPITSYRVERRGVLRVLPYDDTGWGTLANVAGDTLEQQSGGLHILYNYSYRVTARNGAGSAAAVVVPVTSAPIEAPSVNVVPVSASTTRITVTAAATGGPTQVLAVDRSNDGGASWQQVGSGVGTSLTFDRGLYSNAVPIYRGVALSVVDAIRGPNVAAEGEAPGAPVDVSVSVDSTVKVHWAPPSDGGPAQRYQIFEDGTAILTANHYARNVSFIGRPGSHSYTVVARNVVGAGPSSLPATLALDAAAAPTALMGLVTEDSRWATVNLTWAAPADDGGAPIQGYHIYRRSGEAGSFTRVGTTNATTTTFEEDHLSDNHTHHYEVRAHTAVGGGVAATYAATVSDYAWKLTQDLTRFSVCEGTSCTDVPEGGTYTRSGTGVVTYNAEFHGRLTRQGVPQEGLGVLVTMWEEGRDEFASSAGPTTDANGEYAGVQARERSMTPSACRTVKFIATARYWPEDHRYEHAFTLCA